MTPLDLPNTIVRSTSTTSTRSLEQRSLVDKTSLSLFLGVTKNIVTPGEGIMWDRSPVTDLIEGDGRSCPMKESSVSRGIPKSRSEGVG